MDRYFLEKLVLQIGGVIAIGAILGGFVFAYNVTYNTVVSLEGSVDEAWSRLYQDMSQRYGLIETLRNASPSATGHEGPLLDAAATARRHWETVAKQGDMAQITPATEELDASLLRLVDTLQGDPALRDTGPVRDFIAGLQRTGERVTVDRQRYNRAVEEYNTTIGTFPASLWVENWGFSERPPFTPAVR